MKWDKQKIELTEKSLDIQKERIYNKLMDGRNMPNIKFK